MILERGSENCRLRAECSPANAAGAEHVLDEFVRMAAAGKPLRAGTQLRFGWSLLRLVEDGDALRASEPDFAVWPEQRWVRTIDITVAVLRAQTGLLHALDADGEDVLFDQRIVAARGALAQPDIFLKRVAPASPRDSGWLLGSAADPEALGRDELESVFVAHLVDVRAALLQVLVLPAGFIATFSGEVLEQVFDAAGRPRLAGPATGAEAGAPP